jgi:beta-lactamase regulating signal transducer with metallopeptidase domain
MNLELQNLSLLSATATGALISAIWEGTALALIVLLCLRFLPRLSAAARSVVWLNVFVLLVLLHVVPAFAPRSGSAEASHASSIQLDVRWSLAIAAIWAGFSLWRAAQLIVSAIQLHRLAGRATPIEVSPTLQAALDHAAGVRRAEICISNEVARPSVLGFFRPRILLPPVVAEKLSAEELRQVILHEMEHLRRADDWTNLLQKIGLVLFPLNPVLYWVERRLCAERELACDDSVLRSGPGRKAYAVCLTHLAEYSMLRRSLKLALGAWERRPELVRRVQRILEQPIHSMGRKPAMAATGSLIAGALLCALVLARSPQLIRFTPSYNLSDSAQSMTGLHDISRPLEGTPQLVKAVMPLKSDLAKSVQPEAARTGTHPSKPSVRTAVLRTRLHKPAVQSQRTLLVLTQWTGIEQAPRLVMTVSQDGSAVPMLIPASYAVVATPNGWLIVQI